MRRDLSRYIPPRYLNRKPSVRVNFTAEVHSSLVKLDEDSPEAMSAIAKKPKKKKENTRVKLENKPKPIIETKESVVKTTEQQTVVDVVEPLDVISKEPVEVSPKTESPVVIEDKKETKVEPVTVIDTESVSRESSYAKKKKAMLENN